MHDIEAPDVLLTVHDNTRTPHVTATSHDNDVAGVKFDEVSDLALLNVELDGVVDLDERIRVPDGAAIVSDDVWDTASADGDFADFKELVGSFLRGNTVDGESPFDVVEETEVFARFFNRDDV